MMEGESKTVEGVCEEISEKNGWTQFHVNAGTQYPVKLSTKVDAIVKQGRAAGSEHATWRYKETQGNENPNKPGTYYTNRYLESVEVGSHTPAEQRAHAVPEDDRQRMIVRQSSLKAALDALPLIHSEAITEAQAVAETIRLAAVFEHWVLKGTAVSNQPASDEPPIHDESDIPFAHLDLYDATPEWRDPWRRG